MSVILSSITGAVEEDSVEIAGQTVSFSYKPYALTLDMAMKLSDGGIEMITVLDDVLVDWDLTLKKGQPFPVNEENIRALPVELATLFAQKITGSESEETGEADASSFSG